MLTHNLGLELALAANAAYLQPGVGDGEVITSSYATARLIDAADGALIIALQGSAAPKTRRGRDDWLSNLGKHFVACSDGRPGLEHAGFARTSGSVLDPIIMRVDSGRPLYLTGHSKGGAEATRVAAVLHVLGYNVQGGATFASPRIFNGEAAAWFNAHLPAWWRYSYQSDWIPRVFKVGGFAGPTCGGLLCGLGRFFARATPRSTYKHAGRLWWEDGSQWRNDAGLVRRLGAFAFARSWPLVGDSAADHSIGRYIKAISDGIAAGDLE